MSRMSLPICGAFAGVLASAVPALAEPAGGPDASNSCFQLNNLQSTRADGASRIYLRVGVSTFYRIDLAHRCTSLPYASNGIVITPAGGANLICHPLDLDIKANDHGALEPCFIKSITRLTAEEAAAIPKRAKP